jgi:ribosomal protein S10
MTTTDPYVKNRDRKHPRIAILPPTKSMYTLTKAPMAHKTNSKEQFLFKFYNFKFSFNLKTDSELAPTSLAQGAHSLAITKKLFPVFETNMLFLKNYEISYPVCDQNFFARLLP